MGRTSDTTVSVVIPALNEQDRIAAAVASAAGAFEVIVVDGASEDTTAIRAREAGARVISAPRGRARQMNAGARTASGDVVLFLHADTVLPPGGIAEVRALLGATDAGWGRFDVRFDARGPILDLIAWLISTRSRLTGGATGDQAIFVRRELFESLGGFIDEPLFEDVDLCRRLKRRAAMAVPTAPVLTSARRWTARGSIRTSLLMWSLKAMYFAGVSPARLARWYDDLR